MDLKGKSWVGSIYQKFEAICQEVDNFVSKDTVKFVENRAQNIGVSVKRLYSDMEQDEIPPLKCDTKPETRSGIGKQADIRDHDTPISSNMTKFYLDDKLLPVEQGSNDTLNKCDTSRRSDVGLVASPTMTHGADSFHKTKTSVSLKEDDDTIVWNDSGEGVEEKISKAMRPVTVNPSSKNQVLCVTSDEENHDECNTALDMACSPSLSVHEAELLAFKQQGSIWNSFSDEAEYFSNVPSNGWLSEGELLLGLEFSLEEDKSLPQQLEASADKGHRHDSPLMDSTTLLACDAAQKPSRTCETLHDSLPTKDEQSMDSNAVQSSEIESSCCSHDDEKMESSVLSSSQDTPSISLNLLDSTSANYTLTAENICNTQVGSNGYNHHISVVPACSPSSATVSNEIKAVDMFPPFSTIKSNDYNVSATHGLVSVVSSESQHPQCYKGAQSTLLMSPSKSGISCLYIDDLNMERIDLSTDEKHDVFNTNFYRATLHRQKNFRYYKKLLKDAFSSRKRLSKEYEHLAILQGNVDMESTHIFEPSSLPPSTASLNMATSQPSHKISDSDWEVL
ncbi:uncharacterized protein LOC142543277 isoform X1 [Primulina tabacum]|uniref:uncharacterized protein LOC142543277 isoform X1 n=1 Tax=Primulina tabacum TaxID=48773 RepID=UPI003F5AB1EE